MSPTDQDDSCDVTLRIEANSTKHLRELIANPCFVFFEGGAHHFCASPISLLLGRIPGIGVEHLYGKDNWRVRTDGRTLNPSQRQLRDLDVIADALKPAATAYSQLV